MRLPRTLLLTALVGGAFGLNAEAGSLFHHHDEEGTPPPGCPRSFEHTFHRAGHPDQISRHAELTRTPSYDSYYVGGGTAFGGCPRRREEGTWGRDYQGLYVPRRVWLDWSHGRRYQGGTGSYKTDGPHVPDIIGLSVSTIRNR